MLRALMIFAFIFAGLNATLILTHAFVSSPDPAPHANVQPPTDHVYPIHTTAGDITVSFHDPIDQDTINTYAQAWTDAITNKDNQPICTRPMQDTYSTTTKDYTATTHTTISNDQHAQLLACSHLAAWDNSVISVSNDSSNGIINFMLFIGIISMIIAIFVVM